MTPFQSSSGDLAIDRRADYAEMLLAERDPAAAAGVLLGALELAPDWAYGWFRAGEMHEAAGQRDAAATAYGMAFALDPDDRLGACLKLGLLQGDAVVAVPPAFIETLFDQYAPIFDAALVERLGYRIPEILAAAIEAAAPGRRFRHAVDLGCGTGLMGVQLRSRCDRLEGVDLSSGMLRQAGRRGVYDRLTRSDLGAFAPDPASLDLVTAADVFIYVGDLAQTFSAVALGLETGGLFAFSVELADRDVLLRDSRRYAHGRDYVARLLSAHGFSAIRIADESIRRDRGADIPGLVVLASRD